MRKNNKLYFGIVLVFIILLVGFGYFVNSEETPADTSNVVDIGEIIGFEDGGLKKGDLTGEGIKYQQSGETDRLIFEEKDAVLNIKGNKFENIMRQDDAKHPTFIDIDGDGNIIEADFTTNEKGGSYVFGDTEINVPPNSRVFFNQDEGVTIRPEKGSEIEEFSSQKGELKTAKKYLVTYEGVDIKLPSGEVMSGKLGYNNGQAFVASGENTIINGVEIDNPPELLRGKNVNIFFDGKEHPGSYVSFGDKTFVASSTEGVINFDRSNPYVKIEKGDNFAIKSELGSVIKIENRNSRGLIPKVTAKGSFIIEDGSKWIFNDYDKIGIGNRGEDVLGSLEKSPSASPIELIVLDKNNRPLMKGHKVLVNNFNQYAITPEGANEFLSFVNWIPAKFSTRIKYNYPTKTIDKILIAKKK